MLTPHHADCAESHRCALGAAFEERYHASFITFPKPLATFFADKSKILLDIELDSPSVSTVQTLVLLSLFEATNGNDARIWLYSGKCHARYSEVTHARRYGNETYFRPWSPR